MEIARRGILVIVIVLLFGKPVAFGQSLVQISVDTRSGGFAIPSDFVGLSFEMSSMKKNNAGIRGYLFDSTDSQCVHLFRELGIRSLRMGGNSADYSAYKPSHSDIDALFGFAKASGARIIYTLRLLNSIPLQDASTARYICSRYGRFLDSFAIGNEPDWHSFHVRDPEIFESVPGVPGSAFPSYKAKWRRIASAVLDSVPGAEFSGPDAGSNYPLPGSKDTDFDGRSWYSLFPDAVSGAIGGHPLILKFLAIHNYTGEDAKGRHITPHEMIDEMLSARWDTVYYPMLLRRMKNATVSSGLKVRLTETNSFSGSVQGGSNSFATALFALDYMHWWAAHGCLGVNFHTTQWKYNGTIVLGSTGRLDVYPMAYGIKAFDIGGHGRVVSLKSCIRNKLNLTAYAVKRKDEIFITIINKEHGKSARDAAVTLLPNSSWRNAAVMYLSANSATATSGVTLGGATISSIGAFKALWLPLRRPARGGIRLNVHAFSAAIVRIHLQPKS